jgi:hypothetical protein
MRRAVERRKDEHTANEQYSKRGDDAYNAQRAHAPTS